MPSFTYDALDGQGRRVSGKITVGTRAAVLEHIHGQGLRPVSVNEMPEEVPVTAQRSRFPGARRVTQASVEAFTRQLANLLTAGVSLGRALDIVTSETSHAEARRQWSAIRDDVLGGASLAAALAKWPQSFSPVYVAMVRGGEVGGFLNVVLEQIADFQAREQALVGRIKAAMSIPRFSPFWRAECLCFFWPISFRVFRAFSRSSAVHCRC